MKKAMATMALATALALPVTTMATTPAAAGWNDFKKKFSKSECLQRIINFSWVRGDMGKEC